MPWPCFWLEPQPRAERYLHRFTESSDDAKRCPLMRGAYSYHTAMVRIEDTALERDAEGYVRTPASVSRSELHSAEVPKDLQPFVRDQRWPTVCGCGYHFLEADQYQLFVQPLYRRTDSGVMTTLRTAEPGAMWDAFWMPGPWDRGPDGICLVVRTPGGDWNVDGRSSNCTMPEDKWDTPGHHYCWVRHGDPRNPPSLTVDKNGYTCAAGAGSIGIGKYHGFLRGGALT